MLLILESVVAAAIVWTIPGCVWQARRWVKGVREQRPGRCAWTDSSQVDTSATPARPGKPVALCQGRMVTQTRHSSSLRVNRCSGKRVEALVEGARGGLVGICLPPDVLASRGGRILGHNVASSRVRTMWPPPEFASADWRNGDACWAANAPPAPPCGASPA